MPNRRPVGIVAIAFALVSLGSSVLSQPVSAGGQAWETALGPRYVGNDPWIGRTCRWDAGSSRDTLYLLSGPHLSELTLTRAHAPGYTPWERLDVPAEPDTLVTVLAHVECDENRVRRLIIRSDSSWLGLSMDDLIGVSDTVLRRTSVHLRDSTGALVPAAAWYDAMRRQVTLMSGPHLVTLNRRVAQAQIASQREARAERAKAASEQRRALLRRGWSAAHVDRILAGRITIGMTAAMVREAWGDPERINTTHSATGTDEQWVYGDSYVYLHNNVVTAIQTSR